MCYLFQGQPAENIKLSPVSPASDLPLPNINVHIEDHKWEIKTPTSASLPKASNGLPKFDELLHLDSLLPKEEGLSGEDILSQFGPIEETLDNVSKSLSRPEKRAPLRTVPPREPREARVPEPLLLKEEPAPQLNTVPIHVAPVAPVRSQPPSNSYTAPTDSKRPKSKRPKKAKPNPESPKPIETVIDDPAFSVTPEYAQKQKSAPPQMSKETLIDDPAPQVQPRRKKKPQPPEMQRQPEVDAPRDPSPTPSFRRRRASMESAKDFSVLDDGEFPLSPTLSRQSPPKETLLDDPAPAPSKLKPSHSKPKKDQPNVNKAPKNDEPTSKNPEEKPAKNRLHQI